MNKLITIFLFLPIFTFGQVINLNDGLWNVVDNNTKVTLSLTFVSGMADGLAEVLRTHPGKFMARHPNANEQYWLPSKSWKNKYKDYDNGDLRSAYPFAKSALVSTTDGWHMAKGIRNKTAVFAIVLKVGEKQSFKDIVVDVIIHSAAFSGGHYLVYDIIYK